MVIDIICSAIILTLAVGILSAFVTAGVIVIIEDWRNRNEK